MIFFVDLHLTIRLGMICVGLKAFYTNERTQCLKEPAYELHTDFLEKKGGDRQWHNLMIDLNKPTWGSALFDDWKTGANFF